MEDCVSVGVFAVPGDQSPDTVMLAATTAAPTRSVSNLPTGTANIGENKAGIFAHNAASVLVVAEAVRAPVDVLTYFASPSNLRETMPICLKRSSRFKARVFS